MTPGSNSTNYSTISLPSLEFEKAFLENARRQREDAVRNRLLRFMDLSKFLSLLSTGKLFFPRASALGDPAEGLSVRERQVRLLEILDHLQQENSADGKKSGPSLGTLEARIKLLKEQFIRDFVLVCSWHASADESHCMWKVYTTGLHGICIQSTRQRLEESFTPETNPILKPRICDVVYGGSPVIEPAHLTNLLYKRVEFESEKEVRAVVDLYQTFGEDEERRKTDPLYGDLLVGNGLPVTVDLPTLIEKIILAPNSGRWFESAVKDLVTKYGLPSSIVIKSTLDDSL